MCVWVWENWVTRVASRHLCWCATFHCVWISKSSDSRIWDETSAFSDYPILMTLSPTQCNPEVEWWLGEALNTVGIATWLQPSPAVDGLHWEPIFGQQVEVSWSFCSFFVPPMLGDIGLGLSHEAPAGQVKMCSISWFSAHGRGLDRCSIATADSKQNDIFKMLKPS